MVLEVGLVELEGELVASVVGSEELEESVVLEEDSEVSEEE